MDVEILKANPNLFVNTMSYHWKKDCSMEVLPLPRLTLRCSLSYPLALEERETQRRCCGCVARSCSRSCLIQLLDHPVQPWRRDAFVVHEVWGIPKSQINIGYAAHAADRHRTCQL